MQEHLLATCHPSSLFSTFSNTSPCNFDRRTRQTVSSQIYAESLKWSFGADTPLVIDPGRIDDEQESNNLLVA